MMPETRLAVMPSHVALVVCNVPVDVDVNDLVNFVLVSVVVWRLVVVAEVLVSVVDHATATRGVHVARLLGPV